MIFSGQQQFYRRCLLPGIHALLQVIPNTLAQMESQKIQRVLEQAELDTQISAWVQNGKVPTEKRSPWVPSLYAPEMQPEEAEDNSAASEDISNIVPFPTSAETEINPMAAIQQFQNRQAMSEYSDPAQRVTVDHNLVMLAKTQAALERKAKSQHPDSQDSARHFPLAG